MKRGLLMALAAALTTAWPTPGRAEIAPPPEVQDIGVDENLGGQISGDLTFVNERGETVRLGDHFDGERPVILVLSYFNCPMLCGLMIRGVVQAMEDMDLQLGEDYRVLSLSFDPEDNPVTARKKQTASLAPFEDSDAIAKMWPFLTGEASQIDPLIDALGVKMVQDPVTGHFAHPAVIYILTPEGRISRYLYGTDYPARDMKLALVEAADGRIGTTVDKVLLACFRYDPSSRSYGVYVFGILRAGAAILLLGLGGMLVFLWRLERRNRRAES